MIQSTAHSPGEMILYSRMPGIAGATHHRAQPHQPLISLKGTAVDLQMIFTIRPHATSTPKMNASWPPENQCAYSLLWVDSMTEW